MLIRTNINIGMVVVVDAITPRGVPGFISHPLNMMLGSKSNTIIEKVKQIDQLNKIG